MRTHLKRHLSQMSEGADEGFTLIELLVVLLILGILLAIAIPTFLTVTKSATNTAVTSNLQTALTGADTYYTQNNGTYTSLIGSTSVSDISKEGTGLTYVSNAASTGNKVISVDVVDSSDLFLAAWNGSNRCYAIADQKSTGGLGITGYTGTDTYYGWYPATTSAACTAAGAKAGVSTTAGKPGAWTNTGGFPA
ncbi:MAG TPA: prepilin-type N-terminal cleavage/methylation domain-containing protein [Acidimicrobiales bacterium]|nr:prepilin-type N-terminal cleavage/methylation domain-containing protein [Acidimicrobiales bacterium]